MALLLAVTPALAQMAPKPPPELDAMAKWMVGSWSCDGVARMGKMEQKYSLKITWTREMGGMWLVGHGEGVAPGGVKMDAVSYVGYDAALKTWLHVGMDSSGGMVTMTGKGTPDKIELAGKAVAMGAETPAKMTMTRKSDKEVTLANSATLGGQSVTEDVVCKK